MTVKELIKELGTYNQEAEVDVIAHNKRWDFTPAFGGVNDGEGVTRDSTTAVSVYLDKLNSNETFNAKER